MTRGTRVLTQDGAELHGITRIKLIAEVGDVWRAQIDCMVRPDEIRALADVAESLNLWQRLCLRAAGIKWRSGMSRALPMWLGPLTAAASALSALGMLMLAFMLLPPEYLPFIVGGALMVCGIAGASLWGFARLRRRERMDAETEDIDSSGYPSR